MVAIAEAWSPPPGAGKTWMKSTETRTAAVLSMEESGREPPGVGPAGGTRDGGDLVTVGAAPAIAVAGRVWVDLRRGNAGERETLAGRRD